ncbi:MAG TPA: hypothetical protein VF798_16355 [Burkholderiaceae bacterium]
MKRYLAIVVAIAIAAGVAAGHRFAAADGSAQTAARPGPINSAPPGMPSPFASGPAAPEPAPQQAEPQPVASIVPPTAPPPPPKKLPAPIVKELAKARAEVPPNRPMNQVAKNWFGCASEDGYNATLDLIRQKSASSSEHFKGPQADCVPLSTGMHVSVMRIDAANGIAQISVDETHQVYWTDSAALAGGQKP